MVMLPTTDEAVQEEQGVPVVVIHELTKIICVFVGNELKQGLQKTAYPAGLNERKSKKMSVGGEQLTALRNSRLVRLDVERDRAHLVAGFRETPFNKELRAEFQELLPLDNDDNLDAFWTKVEER